MTEKYCIWNQGLFYAVVDNLKDVIIARFFTKEECENYIKGVK
jgi:hypothetical protein